MASVHSFYPRNSVNAIRNLEKDGLREWPALARQETAVHVEVDKIWGFVTGKDASAAGFRPPKNHDFKLGHYLAQRTCVQSAIDLL